MEQVDLIVHFALLVHMPHPLELMDHALLAQLALQILVMKCSSPSCCAACATGTVSYAGLANCMNNCPAGYYASGKACYSCSAGTYTSAPSHSNFLQ